jgi:threonine dehydratase
MTQNADASKPLTLLEFEAAAGRIVDFIQLTPLRRWDHLRRHLKYEAPCFLKLENVQNTGSFKVRGAANKILRLMEADSKLNHFVAASAGNHAQAVAFTAGRLNKKSTIVMPEGTPIVKASATEDYGAKVILHGAVYDEAYTKATQILESTPGSTYVHAYADRDVIIGQGTAGLEIDRQLTELGISREQEIQVIIPVGGGGLVSGVGGVLRILRPKCHVFGVVSEAAPTMALSFEQKKILQPKPGRSRTLAEGLAVKSVHPLTFHFIQEIVERFAIMNDGQIASAIAVLMERGKIVTEGAGAAGVAAALSRSLPLNPKIPLVVMVCGGNIDMNQVSKILDRAHSEERRLVKLNLLVEDRPGELARIAVEIGALRANILEVSHDRLGTGCPVGFTRIQFHIETRGRTHVEEIERRLGELGYRLETSL